MGSQVEEKGKFSQKVKLMRESKEMTQEELSKKVEIDRSSLANIERGSHIPSLKVVTKLAEVLETTIDYLLGSKNAKVEKEAFTQFILRASEDLTEADKERIKQIINDWRKK